MAALFEAVGLTFQGVGFVKLNLFLGPMTGMAHYSVIAFVASPMAMQCVESMPVPVDKVPFFVIAVMPIIAILCGLIASAPTDSNRQSLRPLSRARARLDPPPRHTQI